MVERIDAKSFVDWLFVKAGNDPVVVLQELCWLNISGGWDVDENWCREVSKSTFEKIMDMKNAI